MHHCLVADGVIELREYALGQLNLPRVGGAGLGDQIHCHPFAILIDACHDGLAQQLKRIGLFRFAHGTCLSPGVAGVGGVSSSATSRQ